ncbi:gametocyte-specific factor 1 homolog isoform X2 [Ornithodoros turicata]|uniref:gametocyte-specific factor 1 homolog isoform X2 n=1 Tax=Ornithodoros turicata TaxID=34597 RepID=UPI003139B8E7
MASFTCRTEPLVSCPFNPAHQVKSNRLSIHIAKCRKQHPQHDVKMCPYAADHIVHAFEFAHHVFTCPKRNTVEKYLIETQLTGASPSKNEDMEFDEDWDADGSTQAYKLPSVAPMFRNVQGMTPAQRRTYYASLFHSEDITLPVPSQPESEQKVLQAQPGSLPSARTAAVFSLSFSVSYFRATACLSW